MCLSIPAKVIRIEGQIAEVSAGGSIFRAGIQFLENVHVGDYILLHTGFAIQKIDENEAMETLNLLREINDIVD